MNGDIFGLYWPLRSSGVQDAPGCCAAGDFNDLDLDLDLETDLDLDLDLETDLDLGL